MTRTLSSTGAAIVAATQLPPNEVARLMALPHAALIADAAYNDLLASLDGPLLEATLLDARAAYERGLPALMDALHARYDMPPGMSPYTLGNWLVGYLHYPGAVHKLSGLHGRVPAQAIADSVPHLLAMLDALPQASHMWKRALALLVLPLLAQPS